MKITPLNEKEKAELKSEVLRSVGRIKLREQRIKFTLGIAASIVILIGLTVSLYEPPTINESIMDFVQASKQTDINDSDKVTLILSEDQNLKIDDDVVNINYSKTGQSITLGVTKEVDQDVTENSKVIYNTLLVPYGKRSKVKLSDGSTVWLNSGSRIIYPAIFNEERREVYLEGEAIFDVAHRTDHPFVVVCQDQEVEVLGTVFGVTNYLDENSISTILKSGSVQINYGDERVKIAPGTIASYNKETKSIKSDKINVDNYFSWREGVLIFKNNNLLFILNRLARYYNIKVTLEEALTDETFSGYLDLNDNIEIVLGNIEESANINFVLDDNELIVKP